MLVPSGGSSGRGHFGQRRLRLSAKLSPAPVPRSRTPSCTTHAHSPAGVYGCPRQPDRPRRTAPAYTVRRNHAYSPAPLHRALALCVVNRRTSFVTRELAVQATRRGARERGRWPQRRPADAGVCTSRRGGGTSDNKTLPKYSPRPACDALEAGTARLRGRPHRMMHKRVVLDRAAPWARLGVRVTRGRQPGRQRRDWRTCTASWGEGETSTNTTCSQGCQEW